MLPDIAFSTAEMEEVVASHQAIAECCVVGVADELKGQLPVGFFVLKSGIDTDEKEIEGELICHDSEIKSVR